MAYYQQTLLLYNQSHQTATQTNSVISALPFPCESSSHDEPWSTQATSIHLFAPARGAQMTL